MNAAEKNTIIDALARLNSAMLAQNSARVAVVASCVSTSDELSNEAYQATCIVLTLAEAFCEKDLYTESEVEDLEDRIEALLAA